MMRASSPSSSTPSPVGADRRDDEKSWQGGPAMIPSNAPG
jgi:hypothetical protein